MNNMEKKIAIRGHKTRGAEVIKALEELGGSNSAKVRGHFCDAIYFIDNNNKIHYKSDALIDTDKFQIYTLEEYLKTLNQTEQIKSTNMEKKIAIRGHKTRGAEVIDILKQLGGSNSYPLLGGYANNIYFIDKNNIIEYLPISIKDIDKIYQIYTLEEYLKTLNQTKQMNDKTQRQLSVDIETAKQWYKTDNETLKQLALSLFTEEELTKKLPTSWKEFCEQNAEVDCEYYINTTSQVNTCLGSFRDSKKDKNLLATQEDAEAISALIQLKRLRDAWWKILNYQADWTDDKAKYCIVLYNNEITFETKSSFNVFLAFPTPESRNQFFEYFQDLIQKAKPFLS